MGSSFSIQSKDKRARSNRLSKPPQNQATSDYSYSHSPVQSAEQALSLPSTPTAWQNHWTGVCVPTSSSGTVPPGVQSFTSGPLRREATWVANGPQQNTQSTANLWLPSPTSPTSTSSRQESLYRRASFNPSKPVTFQPTTLQSNPQSPLMGQPKRSYSLHSPTHGSRNNFQRRTLDRFASLNSRSRVNSQECLPIRRRSLLTRPGGATRKATKDETYSLISVPCQNGIVSPDSHNVLFNSARTSLPSHEDTVFSDLAPLSQLRPFTPSDFGYTHLGALKLGSLRVVNESVSPCPSDRTRTGHAGSPAPETIPDIVDTDLLDLTRTGNCVSRATSPDAFEVYTNYHRAIDGSNFDKIMGSSQHEAPPPTNNMPRTKEHIPATTLTNIPVPINREDVDFRSSRFSFEKSPTSTTALRKELSEAEDEAISILDKERMLISRPEKMPERNLSYSSYASSYRKVDSGYSSATSHRASIDSHTSRRRSPGSRMVTFGENARGIELQDTKASSNASDQGRISRHLSLQSQKSDIQQDLGDQPTSMSGVRRGRPTEQTNNRPRGSSLTVPVVSDLDLPLYCAHLRTLECASSEIPAFQGKHRGSMRAYRAKSEDNSPKSLACAASRQYRQHGSGVKSDIWLPMPNDEFLSLLSTEPNVTIAIEPSRGRTRRRSID
ncbi:hypothetical protein BDW59DRAFT_42198 [Aspergillus cavernicola]|uniref:Uncharacterized protein n=1 Tax=Aspergillus cavernicola TaxID=176166 RepID=A0ABR4ILJ8_9EURO